MYNENINILMFRDINELLNGENLNFVIHEYNEYIELKEFPYIFRDNLNLLYDMAAYDYDQLSKENQEKYRFSYKTLKKINSNKYKIETKKYIKKRKIKLFSQTKMTK